MTCKLVPDLGCFSVQNDSEISFFYQCKTDYYLYTSSGLTFSRNVPDYRFFHYFGVSLSLYLHSDSWEILLLR